MNKRTGGTELDHILTNWRAIPLQYQDGYDDRVENNMLSDHILQRVILHIPQMERHKHRKQKKRIRETIDIKITREKYEEGEDTKYTGKAKAWKNKINKLYPQIKKRNEKQNLGPAHNLQSISTWMFQQK